MAWDLSCRDWEQRLKDGRTLVPDLPLDLVAGNRAVSVFNKLRLADVVGTPAMEDAGDEWFRAIVRALFGSLDPVTRSRAIRELFLLVPKKNSKTTNGALLMVTALLLNERPNASLIMTAPVQDVAQLAFDAAAGAIDLDPVLARKLHVRMHLKRIIHRETKAELEIMTFDPEVLTGQKPVAALIDEVHVSAKNKRAASAIRQLRGGMLPYPEAFLAMITTQSEEAPSGVFRAELMKARAIRDGRQDGVMLPILYEFPAAVQKEKTAWRNPAIWHQVTPNAGKSITVDRLVEDFKTAELTSEEELRAWASQHLNIEVGLAAHSDGWAGAEYWEQQGDPLLTLEEVIRRSEVLTAGVDGGGLDDLFGLAVIGREIGTGHWLHWGHAWLHPIALERRKAEAPRYEDFRKDGDLTLVEKIGDDIEQVMKVLLQCETSGKLDRIGLDMACVAVLVEAIKDEFEEGRWVAIPQGWKLTGAIRGLERQLAEGKFFHGDSPLMAWCVGNAKVEPRGNAIVITKQAAGSGKIDPLAALFDAAALMNMNPEPRRKSYAIHHI